MYRLQGLDIKSNYLRFLHIHGSFLVIINLINGNRLVLINKSATSKDRQADLIINESIGSVLGDVVCKIKSK